MSTKPTVVRTDKSGIFLRPTPATPPMGVSMYEPEPPNRPEHVPQPRRLPFWQPIDDA